MAVLLVLGLLVVGAAMGAPTIERDVVDSVAYLETGALVNDNVTVPCTLCAKSMTSLLEFCRDFEGKSMVRIEEFVSKCSHINEEELMKQDRRTGCSEETVKTRSRARTWNRKMRCLKIYNALAETYSPFDPCTQIRNVVEKAPMSICDSRHIKCQPPPSDEDVDFVPSWARNASMPFEYPPLTCAQYSSRIIAECKKLKSNDFYARSNLECSSMYSLRYQVIGCESVRQKMVAQDTQMDLCSSLYAKPVDVPVMSYCENTLQLAGNSTVVVPAYQSYLERVKLFKEAWGSAGKIVGAPGAVFPSDETVVQPPSNPQPQPPTQVTVEE